jgi:hypothetical protein
MIGVLTTVLEELSRHADQDWGRPAGGLAWSCRETAVHIGHDLLAYAGQVAGRASGGYLPLDLTVRDEASNAQLLEVVRACGMLLIRAVEGAAEGDRGWHWGATRPADFLVLGANELLVHTYDMTAWKPPADLAAPVVARLFPDAPAGDPGDVLLWCTGRIALPDRACRTGDWTVHVAVEN